MNLSELTHTPLEEGVVEADLITAAQAGDEAAMMALILAYVPGLVRMAHLYATAIDAEDAGQEVIAAFLEYVHTLDVERNPTARGFRNALGVRYREVIANKGGFSGIHPRSVSVYSRVMRESDYDLETALELIRGTSRGAAGGASISSESFLAIHAALSAQFALLDSDEWAEEDAHLLEEEYAAIRECVDRLPSNHRAVVRYAYGFVTGNEMSDAAVVEEWSRDVCPPERYADGDRLTSRRTVARIRAKALDLLRDDFLAAFHGIED